MVEVIAFNKDAGWSWISQYAPYIGPMPGNEYKDVAITYPMLYDSIMVEDTVKVGLTFEAYEAGGHLPSIFLVDQIGLIHIRSDGIEEPSAFDSLLVEIKSEIDDLLDNPPNGW